MRFMYHKGVAKHPAEIEKSREYISDARTLALFLIA